VKFIDILIRLFGLSANELRSLLERVAASGTDAAGLAAEWLKKLDEVVAPEALGRLASEIVRELGDIAAGKFDGRKHPSDGI